MRLTIARETDYLGAELLGRETAEQMRDFLFAVHAACKEHETPRILISIRQSRAVFKPEDYGLSGYVNGLITPACQVALVGDTDEVNSANEYIEVIARQQGVNVRAFREDAAALRWLSGAAVPTRRYRFTRIVIAGAPDHAGIYTLWDGEEVIYYGRADGRDAGGGSTIRSRLLDHYYAAPQRPTHYSWELCANPASRESELLQEHERAFGRLPRYNQDKAA